MQVKSNFLNDALLENRFWLQVLGDHARFILNDLSPTETIKIQKAAYFIRVFDEVLEQARKPLDIEALKEVTKKGLEYAKEIREFKLQIIEEHIIGKIKIGLPPTFLNHMVNEVEEYITVAEGILDNKIPRMNPLYHHLLWLPDATGHSFAIADNLDSTERKLRDMAMAFAMRFEDLYIKADEYEGYTRTSVKDFPALARLNEQVNEKIKMFMEFLMDVKELRVSKAALGTIMPLILDHMYREECYYLIKLSEVSRIPQPDCNPAKPRLE